MLKEKLSKDIIQAMKDKDTLAKGVLQLVKSQIEKLEIQEKRGLTPDEEIQMVQREVKQTKESLEAAEKYDRQDLVAENKRKLEILSVYLPEQLDEAAVIEVVKGAGVVKGMNMGEAMKLAMPLLKGKTESALISKVVKSLIWGEK